MIAASVGNRGAFLKMATDAAALDADLRGVVRDLAREYNRIVAAELRRPKSGILYGLRLGRARYRRRGGRVERLKRTIVRSWRASAPNEPPAVFTGNLLRGLRVKFPTKEKGYGARVYSHRGVASHKNLMEFGTGERIQRTLRKSGKVINRKVGRVAPRPIWTPLQKRAMDDLERRLLRAIDASAAFRGAA